MSSESIVRWEGYRGEEVALTVGAVQKLYCPQATGLEAYAFIRLCLAHRLNPALREAYLVKYRADQPAQIIIGEAVWRQIAERNPRYRGFRQGIIVRSEGGLERRESGFRLEGEELLGGWCRVIQEGREDVLVEVPMRGYAKSSPGPWRDIPETMIQKVARSQALRLAFPSETAGMYDVAEVGAGTAADLSIIEGESREVLPLPIACQVCGSIMDEETVDGLCLECRGHDGMEYAGGGPLPE